MNSSSLDHEIGKEATKLELQLSRNVIPTAEVVYEEVGVRDTIIRITPDEDPTFDFFVETARKKELQNGTAVSEKLIQTLGIITVDESVGLIGFGSNEQFPIPLGPSSKEYMVKSSPTIKVINRDLFTDFNFRNYPRLVELAGYIAEETMDPSKISGEDHLLDTVYGQARQVLKSMPPDFTNYRHLVAGRNMAEVRSVYKLNGETWRRVAFDDMSHEQSPMIWTHLNQTKVVSPREPEKALQSLRMANELLQESLIFPIDL